MPLLEVSNLTKYYGANLILEQISFQIDPGTKTGLIGPNGCGKTTLLNIIEGREDYDSGRITFQTGLQLGYLTQEPQFSEGLTVEGEMLAVFADLRALADQISAIEHAMGDLSPGAANADHDQLSALMDKYSNLRERFERQGGYEYRPRIRSVLNGLGLPKDFWDRQTSSLSGGEKTRLSLARLLLSEPDLLLLDEPTNYLDIQAVEWLEHFMKDYRGAVLAVSHDRYFLDRIAQGILEMEDHHITSYAGNYSSYLLQRQQLIQSWEKAYSLQQKEISRQEKMIRESRETEKAKKEAASRQKRLDLVQRLEKPPGEQDGIRLKFGAAHRSGKRVLEVENLTKAFDSRQILKTISFALHAGDKIALLGPNGSGKTTLLRILMGDLVADDGRVRWGHAVTTGYYSQEQPDLNLSGTPFEEILNTRGFDNLAARNHLALFQFKGDDVFKRVEDLSGGERRRLALAKLVLDKANFLILDEPTNHLDLRSIEALENALTAYEGTLLFVSHDRYFVNKVAQRLLLLSPEGHIAPFEGKYEDYQNWLAEQKEALAAAKKEAPASSASQSQQKLRQLRRPKKVSQRTLEALASVEAEIASLEERRTEIAELLCTPEVYQDYLESQKLTDEDQEAVARLQQLYDQWSELTTEVEASNVSQSARNVSKSPDLDRQ